jgi:hypothetical protein
MEGRPGAEKVAEITRWHVEQNGWSDIGYHFVIDRDGKVFSGRPLWRSGAFEPKVNATGVGVCLIGGYGSNATDQFLTHYTQAQDDALRMLIGKLKDKLPGIKKITGHNDYSTKGCPGFKVKRWLDGKGPRTFAESGIAQGSSVATVGGAGLLVAEAAKVMQPAPVTQAIEAVSEVRHATEQVQAATADPLRWLLIALVVAGACFALYRRWQDWQAGRT